MFQNYCWSVSGPRHVFSYKPEWMRSLWSIDTLDNSTDETMCALFVYLLFSLHFAMPLQVCPFPGLPLSLCFCLSLSVCMCVCVCCFSDFCQFLCSRLSLPLCLLPACLYPCLLVSALVYVASTVYYTAVRLPANVSCSILNNTCLDDLYVASTVHAGCPPLAPSEAAHWVQGISPRLVLLNRAGLCLPYWPLSPFP